jgi:hypothetical protein
MFKINIRPSKSKHLSLTKPERAIAYRASAAILRCEVPLALLDAAFTNPDSEHVGRALSH